MFIYNSKISASIGLISLVSNLFFPNATLSERPAKVEPEKTQEAQVQTMPAESLATLQGKALIQSTNPEGPKVKRNMTVTVTAYSSTVDQTDSSPFITAAGTHVREGIVACNFLPFGTKIRFPQLSKNKIYVVEDRMAKKNNHKIDIWFTTREQAKQFGVKRLRVEVLEI